MKESNEDLRELFAEARAIYLAMLHNAISYQQAKERIEPILLVINSRIKQIALEYDVKRQYISINELGETL